MSGVGRLRVHITQSKNTLSMVQNLFAKCDLAMCTNTIIVIRVIFRCDFFCNCDYNHGERKVTLSPISIAGGSLIKSYVDNVLILAFEMI